MSQKETELFDDRLKKLARMRDLGLEPYPTESKRSHTAAEVLSNFSKLEGKKITLAGRVRALRGHGALSFGNLQDASGRIQFLIKEDESGKERVKSFSEFVDVGDFLELSGELMKTKRGEKSLLVRRFKVLSKSLRALPEKWHGLTDTDTRLRRRYLDMLSNPEVAELFKKKAVFWKSIRDFLEEAGFLEVENATLEAVPGGAEAEPFVTHHKALDEDFYLRISLELPLKKLLVAGFEKVFELGRIFRNEGISTEHLQDYTQMEFYWAYANYHDLVKFLPRLYKKVVKDLFGGTKVTSKGKELDWGKKWKRYDYYELFEEHANLDLKKATEKELAEKLTSLGGKAEKYAGRGRLIDLIYKKAIRPKLVEPGFLLDPPVEIEPLAKRLANDEGRVQRLQVVAWGTELGKGFTELNDPIDQKKRFSEQMKLREQGDREAQMMDESYVEALEYGMPPAAGFGLSERFFAVLMDKSVRETVISPLMKRKE